MIVQDLIDMLKQCNRDAEVYLMTQPSFPKESEIYGVVMRKDFFDEDEDSPLDKHMNEDDVIILRGDQLCYGNPKAWDVFQD